MSIEIPDGLEGYGSSNILLLDGGMGTILEDALELDYISHSPLWSAKAVVEDPEAVIDAHLAFLRAGAQIIQTSTYQCSFQTFERAGYTRVDARRIMLRSVELAATARTRFNAERKAAGASSVAPVLIALSLGPYGAMLVPTQEYAGYYPPPYGPKEFTSQGNNVNHFTLDQDFLSSIDALERFHLERLEVFMEEPSVRAMIDCVSFETVPLAREVTAIRRAVTKVFTKHPGTASTFWWISCVFPDGTLPEWVNTGSPGTTARFKAASVLSVMFNNDQELATPQGIGINCTRLEFLPELVAEFQAAIVGGDRDTDFTPGHGVRPWLVLYPNGGDVYDPIVRCWTNPGSQEPGRMQWAQHIIHVLQDVVLPPKRPETDPQYPWAGAIVGGCCRVGAEEIQAIKEILSGSNRGD